MNVVHVYSGALRGGVFKVTVEECNYLNILGNSSIIVTSLNFNAHKKVYIHSKLPASIKFLNPLSPFLCSALTVIRPKLSINFKPDWIIAQNIYSLLDALRLARNTHARLCVIIHSEKYSLVPLYVFGSLIENKNKVLDILRNADLIIAVNKKLVKKFSEELSMDVKYIPLGCEPIEKIPSKRNNFALCISRLSLEKGIDRVALLLSMADKTYPIIFAGHRTSTTRKIFKKILDYDLKNFKMVYDLSNESLSRLYVTSRFFIGFSSGLPPLEAAAHGSPVVCDHKSWADEYFIDRVHGFIYKNDDEMFSRGPQDLRSLMMDDKMVLEMGYKAWKLVKEKFTWMHHTKKLEKYLKEST